MAEGWYVSQPGTNYPQGSASYRRHNPGNLRLSIFQTAQEGGFAVFENDLVGFYAIVHQLYLYASGNSANVKPTNSIGVMIEKYAGVKPGTPNFNNYLNIIEKLGGVSKNDEVRSLLQK